MTKASEDAGGPRYGPLGALEALWPKIQQTIQGWASQGPQTVPASGPVVPMQAPGPQVVPSPAAPGVSTLEEAAKHPVLGKYFTNGAPNPQSLLQAPDEELKQHVGLLSPAAKAQLQERLSTFKPSFGQRIGARAMGIDIDAQRQRFGDLLKVAVSVFGHEFGKPPEEPGSVLAPATVGLAGLGAAGHMGMSGLRNVAPSHLDLGHMMWSDKANVPHLNNLVGADQAQKFHTLANQDPSAFKRMLTGAAGHPDQEALRRATFTGGGRKYVNPGDVLLSSFDKTVQLSRPAQQFVTGGGFHHVDVGLPTGKWKGISTPSKGPLKDKIVPTDSPLGHPAGAKDQFVHLRPSAPLQSDAGSQVANAAAAISKEPRDYAHGKTKSLAAREIFPELNTPNNSALSPLLHGPADRCPGGVCSTWTANLLNKVAPGTIRKPESMTPNEYARVAKRDRAFRVMGMTLPEEHQTAEYLKRQNMMKYGPLAMRSPLIAGAAGLGLYGLNKAVHNMGEHTGS